MNIAWLYLDKRNAAINALKDYEGMNYIIQTAPSEIAATQECMTGIGGLALSDILSATPSSEMLQPMTVPTL